MPIDITDVSNNNMHLTNVGNVLYASEGLLSYYRFDGTNYLYYPTASVPEFDILGNEAYVDDPGLTLMCWVRISGTYPPPAQEALIAKLNTATQMQYHLAIQATSGRPVFALSTTGNSTTIVEYTSSFIETDWNFFCCRWVAGGAQTIFVNDDSVSANVVNAPLFAGTARFHIGARESSNVPTNFFTGDLSRIGVYASALTDDQILTIYDMTAPLFKSSISI